MHAQIQRVENLQNAEKMQKRLAKITRFTIFYAKNLSMHQVFAQTNRLFKVFYEILLVTLTGRVLL